MKQLRILAVLAMAFCVCSIYAQTEVTDSVSTYDEPVTSVDIDSNDESSATVVEEPKSKPNMSNWLPKSVSKDNMNPEMMNEMLRYFNTMAQKNQLNAPEKDYRKIYVPVEGKHKFRQRHHLDQRLEISVMAGKDGDDDEQVSSNEDEAEESKNAKNSMFNYGLNVGYSLVFIPGHVEGDQLRINRFGFAYSTGIIASYDKNDTYGVTCDFMLKLGIETGYGHNMGIGFDILLGTGKSAGDYVIYYNDDGEIESLSQPFTKWCFKRGAQFWVRTGMLGTALKNTDIRLFARYVYSQEPDPDPDIAESPGIFTVWQEESWQFGLTFCYTF